MTHWEGREGPSIGGEREHHRQLNRVLITSLFLISTIFLLERSLGRTALGEMDGKGPQLGGWVWF